MSDHRERSSLSLWFFPSQSRPGGQVPASNSLRSPRRDSPNFCYTRRCSRLLIGCFSQYYAVNESGAESRGKENDQTIKSHSQ